MTITDYEPTVSFRLDEHTIDCLRDVCRSKGIRNRSDLLRAIIRLFLAHHYQNECDGLGLPPAL